MRASAMYNSIICTLEQRWTTIIYLIDAAREVALFVLDDRTVGTVRNKKTRPGRHQLRPPPKLPTMIAHKCVPACYPSLSVSPASIGGISSALLHLRDNRRHAKRTTRGDRYVLVRVVSLSNHLPLCLHFPLIFGSGMLQRLKETTAAVRAAHILMTRYGAMTAADRAQ